METRVRYKRKKKWLTTCLQNFAPVRISAMPRSYGSALRFEAGLELIAGRCARLHTVKTFPGGHRSCAREYRRLLGETTRDLTTLGLLAPGIKLPGVEAPTGFTILHFMPPQTMPIIDVRTVEVLYAAK